MFEPKRKITGSLLPLLNVAESIKENKKFPLKVNAEGKLIKRRILGSELKKFIILKYKILNEYLRREATI